MQNIQGRGLVWRSDLLQATEWAVKDARRTASLCAMVYVPQCPDKVRGGAVEAAERGVRSGVARSAIACLHNGGLAIVATVPSAESAQALASRVRWAVQDAGVGVGLAFVDDQIADTAEAAHRLCRDAEAAGLGAREGEIVDGGDTKEASELVEALRNGQLKLWYQRIIDVETGETRAATAQVRWDTQNGTAVSADRFWEMACQVGAARDVTMWALKTAAMETTGRDGLRVHVPCDLATCEDAGFPEMVMEALMGEARERIVLDVSGDAKDVTSRMSANLRLVRGMGVGICLDSITEGWSGLSRLASVEWDYVKIERSVCHRASQKPRAEAVVRAVVGAAQACSAEPICMGIENEEDAKLIAGMGVKSAEGYLWSRPGPARILA